MPTTLVACAQLVVMQLVVGLKRIRDVKRLGMALGFTGSTDRIVAVVQRCLAQVRGLLARLGEPDCGVLAETEPALLALDAQLQGSGRAILRSEAEL